MDDDITLTATSKCLSPTTTDINPALGLKGSSFLHHITVTYPASKAWNKVSRLVILRKLREENSNNDGMTERNALITAHRAPMWPCILCPPDWAGWVRNQLMGRGDVVLGIWVATKIFSFSLPHVTKELLSAIGDGWCHRLPAQPKKLASALSLLDLQIPSHKSKAPRKYKDGRHASV